MYIENTVPYCNREKRRKIEKYRKKNPKLTFTQAYNEIYKTNYSEPHGEDTSIEENKYTTQTTVETDNID